MSWRAPAVLHDVIGEAPDPRELVVVALFGVAVATLLLARLPGSDLGLGRGALAWLLIADIAAGCLANFTRSTNDYYAARPSHRWAFIAVHVHLLAVGWLVGELTGSVVGLWAYVVVGAAVVNALAGRPRQVFVAGLLLAVGLVLAVALQLSPVMRAVAALFLLKVLYAFAVDHHAHARAGRRDGAADLQSIDELPARDLLATAFARDPLLVALVGSADAPRSAAGRRNFASFALAMNHIAGGRPRGWFRDGVLLGVALVEPPSSFGWLRASVTALRFMPVGLRLGGRAAALLNRYWLKTREAAPRERHHYLTMLGVDPRAQGQGVGKRLIDDTIARAQAEGSDVVALDTENPANVALYEHLGFVETSRVHLEADGLTIHCLRRGPVERAAERGGR